MTEELHVEQLAALEEMGRVTRSRGTPTFPDALEATALYLAIAYTGGSKVIAAPDKVLDRLRELGWFRSVRPRVSPSYGVGWMDCCGVAWLDWERVKRTVDAGQAHRFVREVLSLQLAKP